MLLGKVIGSVWATKKEETLDGLRFLLINPFTLGKTASTEVVVATVDPSSYDELYSEQEVAA